MINNDFILNIHLTLNNKCKIIVITNAIAEEIIYASNAYDIYETKPLADIKIIINIKITFGKNYHK